MIHKTSFSGDWEAAITRVPARWRKEEKGGGVGRWGQEKGGER